MNRATLKGRQPAIKRIRKKRIPREVREEAFDLLRNLRPPAEIARELEAKWGNDAPSRRQIERYKVEVTPRDTSDPWSLSEEVDRHGCALVPPVLAAVIEKSSGRRNHITIEEAKWVIRIRLAAPDLDPWDVWLIARTYMRRQQQEKSATDLDHFLSFAPWRSEESSQRYRNAFGQGWVPRPPVLLESLVRGGLGPGPDVSGHDQTECTQ